MNKAIRHLTLTIAAVALSGCSSSATTNNSSQTQYINISRPGIDKTIMTLGISQNIQVIDHESEPSQTQYIDVWHHGFDKPIQTMGVVQVIDLGNQELIVLKDGRQIRVHNVYPHAYDYLMNGQ